MSEEKTAQENVDKGDGNLDALLQKIYDERGYDFREYKRASLQRRINKRLSDNHLTTYEQYSALLDRNPDEYSKLFDSLLINVSEFFRDPEAWEILDKEVLQKLIYRKTKGGSIRIWSAGCSSGEEPYSVAILLAEKLGDSISDKDIRIYATDMDEKALNEARHGVYTQEKLKNVKEEHLSKYFVKEDGFYKVQRPIRRMVSFGRQDLVSDEPITRLDLIICRNVLIYFNDNLQNRIFHKFHYALKKNSYIFFGRSESLFAEYRLFLPVNKKWRIFEKISTPSPLEGSKENRSMYMNATPDEPAISGLKNENHVMDFYYKSILENVSPGILVINPFYTIMIWNAAAEKMWGLSPEYTVGRNIWELGIVENISGIQDMINAVTYDNKPKTARNIEATDKNGVMIFVDISIVPLVNLDNEKQGLMIITNDVTEDKKVREELNTSKSEIKELNMKLDAMNEESRARSLDRTPK